MKPASDAQPVAAFDQWWDSDKPELADNPYRTYSAAYWAWAAWQAATLAERERAAKVCEDNGMYMLAIEVRGTK